MSKPSNELQAAVAELVAENFDPAVHPTAEELIAYHDGELSEAEEARIQDHLLGCPEDASLVVDLERLVTGELDAGHAGSEFERAASWKGLRSRLAPQDAAPRMRRRRRTMRPDTRVRQLPWLHAVAASFLLATLGLSGWVVHLRQTVAEISRPQLNAPVQDLSASASRGGEAVTVMPLAPEVRLFTLVLNPVWHSAAQACGEYDLDVARVDGERVLSERGLRPNAYGSLSLTVSRQLLDVGEYRIRLYPSGEPRGEPAAEFALRIEEASEAR